MKKQFNSKSTQNKYKQIIMQRLNQNQQMSSKKSFSNIQSLKTQCTPNDKTQDICQKIFDDFDLNFKVKYKPVILQQKLKPIGRCLYTDLIHLLKKSESKQKELNLKFAKSKIITEPCQVSDFDTKYMSTELNRKSSKSNLIQKSKSKITQNKASDSQKQLLKRQLSLNSLKTEKSISMKKVQSKKDLKDVRPKRNQLISENYKAYTMKNIKNLIKKNQYKN